MTDQRLADLAARLPGLRLLTELADLIHYGRDWTRRWGPSPLAVALPDSVEQVQAIVRWANERHVALVPSGGRTGLSGGAVAARGELVLSLERMNRVIDFNATDRLLQVQAGITLHAVHEAARAQGLLYPVDFAARGSCTIGGNVATNAGGIRVLRYGTTREWIGGLSVVAGNGANGGNANGGTALFQAMTTVNQASAPVVTGGTGAGGAVGIAIGHPWRLAVVVSLLTGAMPEDVGMSVTTAGTGIVLLVAGVILFRSYLHAHPEQE